MSENCGVFFNSLAISSLKKKKHPFSVNGSQNGGKKKRAFIFIQLSVDVALVPVIVARVKAAAVR